MTAGHCALDAYLSTWYYDNGVAIGGVASEDYYTGSNADVGLIYASEPNAKNLLYGNNAVYAINGELQNGQQIVGTTLCMSARNSGWKCGNVGQINIDVSVGGVLIHHMWRLDASSVSGDSGAPIVSSGGTLAAGILSANSGNYTYYSTIDWTSSQTAAMPCYDTSC